jgi:hypothetical protein
MLPSLRAAGAYIGFGGRGVEKHGVSGPDEWWGWGQERRFEAGVQGAGAGGGNGICRY